MNADGSFVLDVERVMRINEERAITSNAQRSVTYNRTLETLDIVEAYTLKPDGRKVVVTPDRIKEQQELESAQAPMFQDSRVKVVIFQAASGRSDGAAVPAPSQYAVVCRAVRRPFLAGFLPE